MIIGCYPPPYGGQSVHVKELHEFLKSCGFDARVLNIGYDRRRRSKDHVTVKNQLDFIYKLIFFSIKGFSYHLHTHGHSSKSWGLIATCSLIMRLFGRKLYLTLHSGMCPEYLQSISNALKACIKLVLKGTTAVIAVNKEIHDTLIWLGVPGHKIQIIEAFSLSESIGRVSINDELRAFIRNHHPLLSCIGFSSPEYGLDLVPRVTERLRKNYPNIGVIVIGANNPNESEAAPETSAIKWIGLQDRSTSLYLIGKSDVFVRPSLKDGDAVSVREAMALNVPVVASDAGHRPKGVIIFPAGNLREFTIAVEKELQSLRKTTLPQNYKHERNLHKIVHSYLEC